MGATVALSFELQGMLLRLQTPFSENGRTRSLNSHSMLQQPLRITAWGCCGVLLSGTLLNRRLPLKPVFSAVFTLSRCSSLHRAKEPS